MLLIFWESRKLHGLLISVTELQSGQPIVLCLIDTCYVYLRRSIVLLFYKHNADYMHFKRYFWNLKLAQISATVCSENLRTLFSSSLYYGKRSSLDLMLLFEIQKWNFRLFLNHELLLSHIFYIVPILCKEKNQWLLNITFQIIHRFLKFDIKNKIP